MSFTEQQLREVVNQMAILHGQSWQEANRGYKRTFVDCAEEACRSKGVPVNMAPLFALAASDINGLISWADGEFDAGENRNYFKVKK